jgi:hypothetical protein
MFNIYINKAAELYGVARTRQIYEKAIEVLPEDTSRDMCLRFSDMETKLGEIDRARVIYAHCSQMCDPRVSRVDIFLVSPRLIVSPIGQFPLRGMQMAPLKPYFVFA